MITLTFRTLLVLAAVLGALSLSDLAQPPRLLAALQDTAR